MNDMTPPATMPDAATRLRAERANSLALCIADCHPDDAVQIMTAALQDMVIDSPIPGFSDTVDEMRRDAVGWLSQAPDLEAQVYLDAISRHVTRRAIGITARKRFIATLWNGLTDADKDAFLARFGRVAV
jgi:hypothetical protein